MHDIIFVFLFIEPQLHGLLAEKNLHLDII